MVFTDWSILIPQKKLNLRLLKSVSFFRMAKGLILTGTSGCQHNTKTVPHRVKVCLAFNMTGWLVGWFVRYQLFLMIAFSPFL